MKNITITRIKRFNGRYDLYEVNVFYVDGIEKRFPIKYGQSIILELPDNDCSLSIWYHSKGYKTNLQVTESLPIKSSDKDKNLIFDIQGWGRKIKFVLKEKLD